MFTVSYILNTPDDQAQMLSRLKKESMESLFDSIPDSLRLNRPLDIPPALSELELTEHLTSHYHSPQLTMSCQPDNKTVDYTQTRNKVST